MKKIKFLLVLILILSSGLTLQLANAQENTKEAKENEQKIQQQIEEQKKAMTKQKEALSEQKKAAAEQKKAQEEALEAIDEEQFQLDEDLQDISVEVEADDNGANGITIYNKRGGRKYHFGEPFSITGFPEPRIEGLFEHNSGSDNESTTWDFTKSVNENTFSRDYSFDVEKSVNSVVMSVMGDCKAGEIRIKIVMPNGKTYSDIVIDEFGNLNWRKSFAISEDENQDKAGEWKFKIDATKATGFFKISLRTY